MRPFYNITCKKLEGDSRALPCTLEKMPGYLATFASNMKAFVLLLSAIFFFSAAQAQQEADTIPALKAKDINGKTVKLTDFKGKVTFLRMWKSYDPSIVDLAFLEWLERKYDDKVQYLYLCTDDFTDNWKKMFNYFPAVKGIQLVTADDKDLWDDFLDNYSQIAIIAKDGVIFYQNDYQFEEGLQMLLKE